MLGAMRVRHLEYKFYKANIALPEFLNITHAQLKQLGVLLPFQRKRILFGLLKFHVYKFSKSLTSINPPSQPTQPMQINEYFDSIASALKYLIVVKCSLDFIEREDIFGRDIQLSNNSKEFIVEIKGFLNGINQETSTMLNEFKRVRQHRIDEQGQKYSFSNFLIIFFSVGKMY